MTVSRLRKSAAAILATSALVAAGLTAAAPAEASPGHGHAWGHFKGHCRAVHARGVGSDDGTGTGTTTATLYRGQREIGKTVGMFTIGTATDGVAPFAGTIVFTDTAGAGTLSAPVEGTLDFTTGEFVATSDSVTGTGAYGSVTGKLTFHGVQDLTALTFTEVVHGKLCVPKKHPH